ncbi:hypothetical protein JMUB5695_02797 [Mycobacterium heckeshornense]|uniref:DUF5666 domain-containing protein n=1 Tax=Mycobacterium heckeshornense TaxID=110505 RepID=UPI001AF4F9CF|nr:DUF5666 domain-containing protein [Mycobacterium heckeshornense]BCQ09353.1 hypothetical protein JMUB5695_02797 [Mycobacterium heckeshornense]
MLSAPLPTSRLARLAILTLSGATALGVAACGAPPKQTASPTSSSSAAPAPAHANGKERVAGLIASVSGSTIQVSQPSGNATVDFTPSTKVSEVTPAQLTDVTAGTCVSVRPTTDNPVGNTVTAQSVRVSPAVDGKCPQPRQPAGSATTTPSSAVPAKNPGIHGTVAAVAGNTITITPADGNASQTTVTVTDKTKYSKLTDTDTQAIAQGKCITAQGTRDGNGVLQATAITLQQARNGRCPLPGGAHHAH